MLNYSHISSCTTAVLSFWCCPSTAGFCFGIFCKAPHRDVRAAVFKASLCPLGLTHQVHFLHRPFTACSQPQEAAALAADCDGLPSAAHASYPAPQIHTWEEGSINYSNILIACGHLVPMDIFSIARLIYPFPDSRPALAVLKTPILSKLLP